MTTNNLATTTVHLVADDAGAYGADDAHITYGVLPVTETKALFCLYGEAGGHNVSPATAANIEPFFTPLARLNFCDVVTGAPVNVTEQMIGKLLRADTEDIAALLRCDPQAVHIPQENTAEAVSNAAKTMIDAQRLRWFNEALTVRQTYGIAVPSPGAESYYRKKLAQTHGTEALGLSPTPAGASVGAFDTTAQRDLVDYIVSQLDGEPNAEDITQDIIDQMSITEDIEEAMVEFGTSDYHRLSQEIVKHLAKKFQR